MLFYARISLKAKRKLQRLARKQMVSVSAVAKQLISADLANDPDLKRMQSQESLFMRMPPEMHSEIKKRARLNRKSMARYVEEIVLKDGD